jgi:hypothetical protein
MTDFDRMMFKIMFGLIMRCLFLLLRIHSNNATKIAAEYQALAIPGGMMDKWGVPQSIQEEEVKP